MINHLLAALLAGPALGEGLPPAPSPVAPPIQEIAEGVFLLPGEMFPGRGPDGVTVIFTARQGLIVVDTGRHQWRTDAILEFAGARRRPVAAIVNTHWHLDHSSGNRRLLARFPGTPVYATPAVGRALADGGFIARELARAPNLLASPDLSDVQKEEVRGFVETMQTPDALRPSITVSRSQRMRIGGRALDVHVANNAVTDADIWLYDRRTRVAVLGDLVTFPAPFFETACPNAWRAALDEVWATPFRIAVPGHGEPMTRPQFDAYRMALNQFLDCVDGEVAGEQCAAAWTVGIAQFLNDDRARQQASAYAGYYVDFLRQNGGRSPDCLQS
jgi:glyoxylase-like metal-dependent hydrolase (beta-lactamase superfamily II)